MVSFKDSYVNLKKAGRKEIHDILSSAKCYEDLDSFLDGRWTGEAEMQEIVKAIRDVSGFSLPDGRHSVLMTPVLELETAGSEKLHASARIHNAEQAAAIFVKPVPSRSPSPLLASTREL